MRSLVALFFLFLTSSLFAQRFGGNPISQKWKQIDTDTVRVVFPAGQEQHAVKIASIIHGLQQRNSNSLGSSLRKVSMVLQHRTLISNGYVGLAPFRSELYTTAPQNAFNLGAADWLSNLAIHEFRHVQQYSNFNRGLSKLASLILGEEGQAVANATSIPDWFFEGDAVYTETQFTRQGRGSLPKFFSAYQSLHFANKQYSYMKLRNGSLRHFVPDHYDLGYLLVAYGRKKYGNDLWQKVTDDAARFKPLIYPFQGAVKKHTGIPFSTFVDDALNFYRSQWISASSEPTWLTAVEKNNVINYQFPYLMEDGSVITLYNSYSQIPVFLKLKEDGSSEKIAVRDIAIDPYFSYRDQHILYTAYQPDVRWGNVEYHSLKLLDLNTGTSKTIKTQTRLFSPDLSTDKMKLVAVAMDESGGSTLIRTDLSDAKFDTILTQKDIVFSYPRFSKNDQGLYVVERMKNGDMGIIWSNFTGQQSREILKPTNRIIGFLHIQGDTLLFSTTHAGRDELWAIIDKPDHPEPYRLASFPTGIYQGVINKAGKVIASTFTADGYRLASFQPLWEKVKNEDALKPLYIDHSIQQSITGNALKVAGNYPVTNYKRSFQLLNIHSWRPYYDRPEYSFTLYGQNVLNTFSSELAYTFNENERSHRISYDGAYGGTYLQPVFGASQTWQRSFRLNRDTLFQWNLWEAYAGLRLPFNFTGGKQFRNLTLQATLNRSAVRWTGIAKNIFRDANFNYVDLRLFYAAQIQRAVQHIFPRWGQSFQTRYRQTLGDARAWQMLVSGTLYLPGLHRNHNLVLTGAIQSRDTLNQFNFSDNFPFSRGYTAINLPRMYKLGVNYHFPIAYPDWGFGQLVYFQRLRLNAFYDLSVGKSLRTGRQFNFGTLGGELFFDTRWWNQEPVTFGFRYSRLLDQQLVGGARVNYWEIILPVALFR
ncbi:MAG: hypothetical protein U1C70_13940 [Sediminibacterium sp.]|jgi:hypothetical protein|uniref:hypothetical protein n=1 Tax=Sediminibacterium sp. TaxID=1917865 RepID=UPI002ABCC9DC|nr:hypothetical protein [Sediminibacterium sp.]MDZ4072923.1 hypothetical protein [Sediminibacterium sp.]